MDSFIGTGGIDADADELVRLTMESYDRAAEAFREYYYPTNGVYPNPGVRFGLVAFVKELLRRGSGHQVLDAGCGPGDHASFIARSSASAVVGVDRSEGMLQLARTHYRDLRFARMDVRRLAFASNLFDGIWSSCVLQHLPHPSAIEFFNELWRVARPRCTVYVVTIHGTGDAIVDRKGEAEFPIGPRYVSALGADDLAKYAGAAGFSVMRTLMPGGGCVHLVATKP